MSTLFVDTLEPNQNTAITAASGKLLPAGHVVQVVQSSTSTEVSGNQTAYTDAGLSGSITPSSASSKILVIMNISTDVYNAAELLIDLRRNGTSIREESYMGFVSGTSGGYMLTRQTVLELDSPSTTSQVTYTTFYKHNLTPASQTYLHYDSGALETSSTMTLMEIAQ